MSQVLKYYLDQKPLSNSDIDKMKKSKKKFFDELFPPNEESLYGKKYTQKALKFKQDLKYEPIWVRISEMPVLNKLYDEKNFSFDCIFQGSIGDCYLISTFCEISQYPKLLINNDKLENSINIIHKYDRDIGYYEFKLFVDGEYQLVILDDYVPYDDDFNDISFAKTSKNYYWVSLLEKAFAKVLGSYSNIVNDDNDNEEQEDKIDKYKIYKTELAFQMLTGFVPEHYSFKEYNKDFIYKKIYNEGLYQINTTKNEILITTGSISKKQGVLEQNHIPYSHSFSILDIKTVFCDGKEIKLLLLNNPWGRNIFNSNMIGNFIQDIKNEKMKDLNKYIQYNIDSLDGTFWIDFDTFFESFHYVSLCKILTGAEINIYKFEKDIYYEKPFIFNLKILEDETDIYLSILYERNKYDKKNEQQRVNFYLILNKINNNEVIDSFSLYDTKEINVNKILNKGYYHLWIYIPQEYKVNNRDKSSLKIVYNKKIIIDFNKFDEDFIYLHNIAKEITLLKKDKENFQQKEEFDYIKSFKIIQGFYIIIFINKIKESFNLQYTIEKDGLIDIITKGFDKIDINKIKINDTLNPSETKIYMMIQKEKQTKITTQYSYLKGKKGLKNVIYNKDYSFYNFNSLTKSNMHLDGIKFMTFNTPPHKKTSLKVYQKLNSYDDDNLIKGLNQDQGNKNRQIRAINEENNIHSFGEFKKSYQNETYSKENIHGFKTKENEKLEIKEEKNKFFYLKNETNSKVDFSFGNKKQKESIFNNQNEVKQKENENPELDDYGLISKFIDYMELMEKKENPNVQYMEVRRKYSKVWNEMKDEDKMIYAFFFEMEKNNEIDIKKLINENN